jgi:hypothetical protein
VESPGFGETGNRGRIHGILTSGALVLVCGHLGTLEPAAEQHGEDGSIAQPFRWVAPPFNPAPASPLTSFQGAHPWKPRPLPV